MLRRSVACKFTVCLTVSVIYHPNSVLINVCSHFGPELLQDRQRQASLPGPNHDKLVSLVMRRLVTDQHPKNRIVRYEGYYVTKRPWE